AGTATFIRLPKLAAALEGVPADRELHVHFEQLDYIDHACLDLLMSWEKRHEAAGGSLVIDWDSLTARFQQFGRKGTQTIRILPTDPATPTRKEVDARASA